MNSIKTFWSPELKKERALRKDEVSKISVWKEQYRVIQDEAQVRALESLLCQTRLDEYISPGVASLNTTLSLSHRLEAVFEHLVNPLMRSYSIYSCLTDERGSKSNGRISMTVRLWGEKI